MYCHFAMIEIPKIQLEVSLAAFNKNLKKTIAKNQIFKKKEEKSQQLSLKH